MLADDYKPSRIEVAKEAAQEFISSIKGIKTKVGIITFAGTTFLKERLTDDKLKLTSTIKEIDIERAGGTAIGDAIISATNLLSESDKARIIILLTDGQNNVGINIDQAIRYANKNKVMIYTIGLASKEGGTFPLLNIISKLDEETLKKIASKTGGSYYQPKDAKELRRVYREIATSMKQKLTKNLSISLVILALLLLFLEWVLQNIKYRTIP